MEESTFTGYLGPEFQLKLLWQLVTVPEFADRTLPLLTVNYFDDSPTKMFFIAIKNYYSDFEKPPSIQNDSISQAIAKYNQKDIDREILNGVLEKIKLWNEQVLNDPKYFDGDIVQKETYTFIAQQEYRKLADFIISEVKGGSTKESDKILYNIDERMKMISEITNSENFGSQLFEDIDDVLVKDYRKPIPTGIKAIDEVTGGGLGRGEIGVLLAPSGVGKTTFLTHCAHTAYANGCNVLQIVFEDTVKEIKRKHFALISDIKLSQMDDKTELVKERVQEYMKRPNIGRNVIVRFSQENTTIPKIKNWIERYQKKFGIKFDIIILDYIDCLEPHVKGVEQTQGEIAIVKAFESMAGEYDIPCWTAIQANRSGFNAAFVDTSQMGGSIKRAQKTHLLISVAKTQEQKGAGLANLQILKARFAQDGLKLEDIIFDNDSLEIRAKGDIPVLNFNRKISVDVEEKSFSDDDVSDITKKFKEIQQQKEKKTLSDLDNLIMDDDSEDEPWIDRNKEIDLHLKQVGSSQNIDKTE